MPGVCAACNAGKSNKNNEGIKIKIPSVIKSYLPKPELPEIPPEKDVPIVTKIPENEKNIETLLINPLYTGYQNNTDLCASMLIKTLIAMVVITFLNTMGTFKVMSKILKRILEKFMILKLSPI